jgi:hypothetical protein
LCENSLTCHALVPTSSWQEITFGHDQARSAERTWIWDA